MNCRTNMDFLGVMADMAGCPNRCRHCWLGKHKNGTMTADEFRGIADQFRNWRDEDGKGIGELGFYSWWREPDYRDDYRELRKLERELSSPGRAERRDYLSIWRLARDESYAPWAATQQPKTCHITFFGMEETTDWGTRRRGAFQDNLMATERLLQAGIAPHWQLFLTKHSLGELDAFLRLIEEMDLYRRTEANGGEFEVFVGGMAPEGNGFDLVDLLIEQGDMWRIPQGLVDLNRDPIEELGLPEDALLEALLRDDEPPMLNSHIPGIAITANYDVYPNIAEPTDWWKLGNLKDDGIDAILRAYFEESTPGMKANREVPISELARRYGDRNSKRLYNQEDLIRKWMHQWGEDYTDGRR